MEKMDLDQIESTKSEEANENEVQEKLSSLSLSKATSELEFNSAGGVQKQEEQLKGSEKEDSLSSKTRIQENEEEEEMEKSGEENPLNLSPENLEPAQKALAIELILIKVLENLPTSSLVSFRLVNKTWEKESTKVIMKESKTHLNFKFDWQSNVVKIKNRNLSELNECIKKSRRFPVSSFDFYYVSLDDSDLAEVFTLHGSEIRRLELHYCQIDPSKLGNLLFHQVPNVQEFLIFGNGKMQSISKPTRLFPEYLVLPRLKSLSYESFPFASEIIGVSPNLQRVCIQDLSLTGVEQLMSMNKIHLLKQVSINKYYENILLVELLAGANPKFEKLSLRAFRQRLVSSEFLKHRFTNAVSKILDSSKETLTHVDLVKDEIFFMGVKWPRLEKVQDLSLICEVNNSIDTPFNFVSHVFPNIQKLQNLDEFLPSLLSCKVPLAHLEECTLVDLENWNVDNLASLAPNLTKLTFADLGNVRAIADFFWACPRLKQLEVELCAFKCSFPQVDMAFTGLSPEMVRKLHEDPDYFNEMKMDKKKLRRVAPFILNCPDLTCLKVVISGVIYYDPRLMTAVSGEFGFKMLQNLHVEIEAIEAVLPSLDALKPYARLSKSSSLW